MATNDTGSSKNKSRRWSHREDAILVSCMVDLHNLGTKNADTGFKAGYLHELEKMVKAKLPTTDIKAKPHIESRVKTLKKEWSIVHDLFTNNNSGFGWDDEKKMVIAEDEVWESYISSHKEATQWKRKSFPFYNEFSSIYAKDRATGRDAQTGMDILEEMANENGLEEGVNLATDDENVGEAEMQDVNFTFTQATHTQSSSGISARNSANSEASGARKKRKNSDVGEPITSQVFHVAAHMLSDTLVMVGDKLSDSIGTELTLQQKLQQLDQELIQVDGLTEQEYLMALIKLPDKPNQMLVFFSLPQHRRYEWVKAFIASN